MQKYRITIEVETEFGQAAGLFTVDSSRGVLVNEEKIPGKVVDVTTAVGMYAARCYVKREEGLIRLEVAPVWADDYDDAMKGLLPRIDRLKLREPICVDTPEFLESN